MALAIRTPSALVDLDVPTPTAEYYLRRNAGDTAYEWAAVSTSVALDDLTDVAIATPAAGQVVRYNGSGWVNARLQAQDVNGRPARHRHLAPEVLGQKPITGADVLAVRVFAV